MIPDTYFPGRLIPNSQALDNNKQSIAGTGLWFDRRSLRFYEAVGIKKTKKGTYRNVYERLPEFEKDGVAYIGTTIWRRPKQAYLDLYKGRIRHIKEYQEPKIKKISKYRKRYERIRWQLKKAEIRRLKQTLDDSSQYKFDKFTQEQFAKAKLKKFDKETNRRYKNFLREKGWSALKPEHSQDLIKKINNDLLVKYKKAIRENIIAETLSKAFVTTEETVDRIRKDRARIRAMIRSGLLWQRGRRRQPAPSRPYTALKPVWELDGHGLSGKIVYKRVVVENPYGIYGRSGDPVTVTS